MKKFDNFLKDFVWLCALVYLFLMGLKSHIIVGIILALAFIVLSLWVGVVDVYSKVQSITEPTEK